MTHLTKSILLAALGCLLWGNCALAQSSEKNFILTREYTDDLGDFYRDKIVYHDGLGRPIETIERGITPSGGDLASYQEYDFRGRKSNSWLPVALDIQNDGRFVGLSSLLSVLSSSYGSDTSPYSKTIYETSPLNRVLEQYGPGDTWHKQGKRMVTAYLTNVIGNDTLTCRQFSCTYAVNRNDTLVEISSNGSGYIPTGSLSVIRTTDEDGSPTWEFKDKKDRLILFRRLAENGFCDTYYIYDDLGNLTAVLPPAVSDHMNTGTQWNNATSTEIRNYAYLYLYDSRNRCKARRLPGSGWTYYLYDDCDQLIFSQNPVQRIRGEWSFALPDAFNRTCLTGICKNSLNIFTTGSPLDGKSVKAVRDGSTGPFMGYSISGLELDSPVILKVNYYDNYDFMGQNGMPSLADTIFTYEPLSGFATRYAESSVTRLTGTMVARLTGPAVKTSGTAPTSYLRSIFYYDNKGRVIQSVSDDQLLEVIDKEYLAYTFTGDIKKKRHIHSAKDELSRIEEYTYHYDAAGRLTSTTHQLDGHNETLLCHNEYDELGRLKTNKRNGQAHLKTDYAYNIRSWVTGINGPCFTQTLHYTDGPGTPIYNGNISTMMWQCGTENVEHGYKFTYDGLSRLKAAVYGEGPALSSNLNRFTEQVTGYDKQGNILGLFRYGETSQADYGLVDNLSFSYCGNQLKKVTDSAIASAFNGGFEFKDGANAATEYEYDENGNLTKDLNKNITDIQYNCLNLPSLIQFEGGNSISYVYDADGNKLRTTHLIEGVTTTTDYCGSVIYENGVVTTLLTEVGYISLDDNKYHYFIQDHQGNNRVVADEDGIVEEVNHYYPFGGVFANSQSVQPYKYNGKELDRKGGLDWYDYGARYYDAALGRWHVVDPMAEKFYGLSPYVYCDNNPIRYVDPTGMSYTGYLIDKYGYLKKVNDEGGDRYDVLYNKEKYSFKTIKDYDTTGNKTGIQISKGILSGTDARNMSSKAISGVVYDSEGHLTGETIKNHAYEIESDQESLNLMNFLDKNTDVEWGNVLLQNRQGNRVNMLNTSHQKNTITFGSHQTNKYIRLGFQVIRADHIHPGNGYNIPSGLNENLDGTHGGDIGNAKNIRKHSPKATFRILNNGKYYDYTDKVLER